MKFSNSLKVIALIVIISCVFTLRVKENSGELLDSEYNTVKYFYYKYLINQLII